MISCHFFRDRQVEHLLHLKRSSKPGRTPSICFVLLLLLRLSFLLQLVRLYRLCMSPWQTTPEDVTLVQGTQICSCIDNFGKELRLLIGGSPSSSSRLSWILLPTKYEKQETDKWTALNETMYFSNRGILAFLWLYLTSPI